MKYGGMTVNERLYLSGNIDKFYDAIKRKDKQTVIEILKEVELIYDNIIAIIKRDSLEE